MSDDATGIEPALSPWATARVQLFPVLSAHLPALYDMETDPDVLQTWRLRGATPTMEDYAASLWTGMADQRLVISRSNGEILGLNQLYNVDLRLRHGWFSVLAVAKVRGSAMAFEGSGLFIQKCFEEWGLRRLYFLSLASNFEHFASLGRRAGYVRYGVLPERAAVGDELLDVTIGGIEADTWMPSHGRLIDAARRRGAAR